MLHIYIYIYIYDISSLRVKREGCAAGTGTKTLVVMFTMPFVGYRAQGSQPDMRPVQAPLDHSHGTVAPTSRKLA